ncbi:hypothetical protein JK358_37875 [Nocardia sp. 2]|uniref:ABC transmembrane type-1 domain-containing protein n=1 Tax=Nocardia acididurans TaxID=2802282 RepID=A0ABS1MHN7_9NOCA|nr:hypothetical protein [Nocardia acididurans]MBL1080180.1 hypothetical protein [Nocardia acididurans]
MSSPIVPAELAAAVPSSATVLLALAVLWPGVLGIAYRVLAHRLTRMIMREGMSRGLHVVVEFRRTQTIVECSSLPAQEIRFMMRRADAPALPVVRRDVG